MEIRAYETRDEPECLRVFDSNVPNFFALSDRAVFLEFLRDSTCAYVVMEHEGRVVGCGGHYLSADGSSARLAWGVVDASLHRNGLGRFLLLYRLKEITKTPGVQTVSLDTTPSAAGFFARQGFKAVRTIADGYGPGIDRVEMTMKLAVCS